MAPSDPGIDTLIRETDAALNAHAATPSALDTVLQKPSSAVTPKFSPIAPSSAASGTGHLPIGISGGKVAAYVAAAAVVGGGLYMMTRKKPEREGGWAEKIQTQRQTAARAGKRSI